MIITYFVTAERKIKLEGVAGGGGSVGDEFLGFAPCRLLSAVLVVRAIIQGIHKRMVRFIWFIQLIPHHSFVYALYMYP